MSAVFCCVFLKEPSAMKINKRRSIQVHKPAITNKKLGGLLLTKHTVHLLLHVLMNLNLFIFSKSEELAN